ncbi:hypothetical protein [Brevundimonas diminuta]|uniref:hypothetical protein n=1 Tax=Brevundimonas diminuta TaxID=293 RepID=UPI0030FB53AC
MSESAQGKATRFEAEAKELHRRSRAAASLPASIVLRFRALWREEAARLLRRQR